MSTADESLPAARERAVDALTRGYAEDLLSEAELEAALDQVYEAKTLQEVSALTSALVPVSASSAPAPMPSASARVTAFMSGQERMITGTVPSSVLVRSRLGHVELDLTRATFQRGRTDIDVRAFMGYVQIRLPAGIRVESEGHAVLGYFAMKGGTAEQPGTEVTVRITGRATFGYAECWVQPPDALKELGTGEE